ncbi:MAG: peptidase, partial [Rhodobacteraceae bacterium]
MSVRTAPALTADQLRQDCDPALLRAGATKATGEGLVGQERGLDALRLAVEMRHQDFNLFVLGARGTGRRTAVETVLRTHGRTRGDLSDWTYVNNFDAPHKPVALALPVGQAARLKAEMESIVDDLAKDVPALFESDEYQTQRRAIDEEYSERHERAMADFGDRARAENIALIRTPMGFMVAAMRDGEVLKTEGFAKLPEDEQAEIDEKISRFQEELAAILRETPKLEREHRAKVEALNAGMAERAVASRIDQAEATFQGIPQVQSYLAQVRKDMIENPDLFLHAAAQQQDGPFPDAVGKSHLNPVFRRYMVNVLIAPDPEEGSAPPVVIEDLPTLDRLAGRIEHVSHMGSLVTDFTMIKPGALHKANGGYLII